MLPFDGDLYLATFRGFFTFNFSRLIDIAFNLALSTFYYEKIEKSRKNADCNLADARRRSTPVSLTRRRKYGIRKSGAVNTRRG